MNKTFVEIGPSNVISDSYDGAWYDKHNDATSVIISYVLME